MLRMSYHIISYIIYHISYIIYHISYIIYHISYHIIYHIISYHIISYHIIYLISYHIISYHIISYYIISYHIISYHINDIHFIINHERKEEKKYLDDTRSTPSLYATFALVRIRLNKDPLWIRSHFCWCLH